jgi:DeoR/GlpR family transcriptional regulator of sugar metabolism
MALVDRERSVRVNALARLFTVTEETIRRDLEKLEGEGKLVRSHGGAISSHIGGREAPFNEREVSHAPEKLSIARAAVALIEESDTVLIDASTTALQLARSIPDQALTVLTNSVPVCTELSNRTRIRVICTGGALSSASLSFVGPRAEQMLADYHVNRLFFSCTGVDLEHGLSDVNESQAVLKRTMMSIADHAYLLVDKSKFGVRALKRFARIEDVKNVITNDDADEAVVAEMQAMNINVRLAKSA